MKFSNEEIREWLKVILLTGIFAMLVVLAVQGAEMNAFFDI